LTVTSLGSVFVSGGWEGQALGFQDSWCCVDLALHRNCVLFIALRVEGKGFSVPLKYGVKETRF